MFSDSRMKDARYTAMELTHNELDLVILGKLLACTNSDDIATSEMITKRQHTTFLHGGYKVCKKTFTFLHGIGVKRLRNIMKHFQRSGVIPRTHGNMRKRPYNALSLDTVKFVVTFILNYSEQHGPVLPGRATLCQDIHDLMCNYCHLLRLSTPSGSNIS